MEDVIRGIYKNLIELSDTKLQRKLWLNVDNDTGEISSYVELMCSLFDDYNLDSFIALDAHKAGLPGIVVAELEKLRDLLNNYREKETDEAILNDAAWLDVADQARIVVDGWNIDPQIKARK